MREHSLDESYRNLREFAADSSATAEPISSTAGAGRNPLYQTGTGQAAVEDLFRRLDGLAVAVGSVRFRLRVYGIHSDGRYRWVQLELFGPPERSFILRMPLTSDADAALERIEAWALSPSAYDARVLTID